MSPKTEEGHPLETPLPVPVRRAHTEMDFDLPDSEIFGEEGGEDDFDLEIGPDDDFDI
ncbi:MAG: hypothetical protein IKG66_08520 [Lachnospiraceae bacterium]|nr:hypothetical protein [Lachnospiraceae bacterium]